MRRYTLLFLAFFLSAVSFPGLSFAYTGGLLQGKTMNNGMNINDTGFPILTVTDGDVSTSKTLSESRKWLWIDLPSETTITSYRLKASSSVCIYFYNKTMNVAYSNCSPIFNDTMVKIPPVSGVKRVALFSASTSIYEFDVFPIDEAPPADPSFVSIKALSTSSLEITWTDPPDPDFKEVKLYQGSTFLATVPKATQRFIVTGLSQSTTYKFKLVSQDNDGNMSGGIVAVGTTASPDTTPPADITNLQTTVYNDRIKFKWNNPPDTDFLEVRIYKGGVLVAVANTPANQFIDYDLEEHTSYTYIFRSVDSSGNVSQGISITEKTKGKPLKPTGVSATPGNGSATVTVISTTYATSYAVYINGQKVVTESLPYLLEGLTNGQTYTIQVAGVNEFGESPLSDPVTVTPTLLAPHGVYIASETLDYNSVSLIFGATDADKIEVYRDGFKLTDLPGNARRYTDTQLSLDTEYKYWIVAENTKGRTASEVITLKTKGAGKISSLRVTEKKTERIKVSWDKDPLAEKYIVTVTVKRSELPEETKQLETTETYAEVTDLSPGDQVSFSVSGYATAYGTYGTSSLTVAVPIIDSSGEHLPTASDVIGSSFSLASNFWWLFLAGAAIILTPYLLSVARSSVKKQQVDEVSARRSERAKKREIRMDLRGD